MMRWVLSAVLVLTAGAAGAQTSVNNEGDIFFRDGNRMEVLAQSPVKDMLGPRFMTGHPYSMVETVTTTGPGQGGQSRTIVRKTWYYRDAQGRERTEYGQEPNGVKIVNSVTLQDPLAQRSATLLPAKKVARVSQWTTPPYNAENAKRTLELQTKAKADRAAGKGGMILEPLGTKLVAGVPADGLRTTFVVPAGREDNTEEIRMVTETWVAQDLKIVVGRTQDDGRGKRVTWVVSDLQTENPDHRLFEIPSDFHAVDQQSGADVQP